MGEELHLGRKMAYRETGSHQESVRWRKETVRDLRFGKGGPEVTERVLDNFPGLWEKKGRCLFSGCHYGWSVAKVSRRCCVILQKLSCSKLFL